MASGEHDRMQEPSGDIRGERTDAVESRPDGSESRRGFLEHAAGVTMAGGLTAGYGMLVSHAVRFLYPSETDPGSWQFVCTLDDLQPGDSMPFTTPAGAKPVVARQAEDPAQDDAFIALSSVCPHLGCKVHWEANNERFFCPCHNGAFDAQGNPIAGPPKAAGQSLTRFPLRIEGNLLMVWVPGTGISEVISETNA